MTEIASRLTAALADRYTIERELGQGGMATVCLAEDTKLHRKVAVKVATRTRRCRIMSFAGPQGGFINFGQATATFLGDFFFEETTSSAPPHSNTGAQAWILD